MTSTERPSGLVELCQLPVPEREELLAAGVEPAYDSIADPLRAITALRRDRPDLSPELASAVIAQRGYRARGVAAGTWPGDGPWLTTEVGLEQASRPAVAEHRARTLAAAGVVAVVDASAGIGMDALAFLAAGMEVLAFERDPITATVCRANLEAAAERLGGRVRVECTDSTEAGVIAGALASLPSPAAVFVDPARRGDARPVDGRRARSERDKQLWSPSWSIVEQWRAQFEYVAAKTPPGFSPDAGWKAEWVAVGNTVVECAVYSPAASRGAWRTATIVDTEPPWQLDFAMAVDSPTARGVQAFLAEVHPVARRSGAIARLCEQNPNLAPVTDTSLWLSSAEHNPSSPVLRWFEVLGTSSFRELADMCRSRGIERVALKSSEGRQAQSDMRARIGLPDGDEFAIVVIAGLAGGVLVRRMRRM